MATMPWQFSSVVRSPTLYDGLKPVTRRVLTAMKWLNLKPDSRYMKAARVSGETMGKLHPHGGAYGAMVTASQPWTNNHPLIDGHGNWGSPTDGPAAERYTEARLTSYAWDTCCKTPAPGSLETTTTVALSRTSTVELPYP